MIQISSQKFKSVQNHHQTIKGEKKKTERSGRRRRRKRIRIAIVTGTEIRRGARSMTNINQKS